MLNKIIDRIKLPFRKEKELYLSLYNIIGVLPHNLSFYKTALLHKSVARRNDKGKPVNNERLEFLGDAILDAIVGDIVYEHFPGKREGFLTNTRSKIVQRETLNKLANDLGITRLILSSGHSQSHNSYLGGNAFEALVGALYLDHGYTACMKFMKKQILGELINIDKVAYKEVNFKSKLIEWTQKHKICLEFKPLSFGKDKEGSPTFSFQVVLEGIACGEGSGYSKKESQQEAAKVTLQYIRKNTKFADKIFKAKQKRIALEQPEDLSVIETTEDNVSVLPLKDDADDESNTFTNIEREDCFSGMVADEKENIIAKAEAEAFE
ncbi:ribonuclease III [Prevotella pallens]|jgi:ribonuclease III|uniref:Ribonuclease 3 n=2 Tax=Prevotella pallens TaxID=60133 RepID=A0A379EXZ1_9BACT|nr:ribonuclease III [Prevotella pallens]EGQ22450.1 ribonuclease 3 [Prevotella pallens ATCC 700821]MBF1450448.1 ribonuclease III [Prevotella pallens]MBF1459085.1 ribonuclease III [Prevotella pallens]MBF1460800.1 ribonuclease III [Prevotella pallens]MBF1461548.1 ribonuclease III [Prevotella pallens]